MSKYGQRDLRWRWIKMGGGEYNIGDYGCLLVSLCNGLNDKGWNLTPANFNWLLQLFTLNSAGKWKNYIDYFKLSKSLPAMFTGFENIEPYPNDQKLYELVNDLSKVVIGRVNAKAIGGTGDHFVLVTKYNKKVATIYDPWTNTEELVTKKYGKYDNLLGFRVFHVKYA